MRKRISECMHALCCLSPVPMESEVSSPIEARSSDENVHQEASRNNISGPSKILPEFLRVMAARGDIPIANDFGQLNISQDGGKSPQNPDVTIVRSLTADGPTKAPVSSGELLETQDNRQSSSQNANVGGILHKWVNFGKGWRPRWFVLQEGVLSYYKVHGPDKITLSDGKHRYSRIIGEESQRLMKKQRNAHRPRKAFGELHLQVASIRKSKSDDKRFYIFTGTKTLHLRAETKEDRATWLEVLNAAKEQFPRSIYCKGLAPPSSEIVISTERLRDRLLKEGLPEDAIGDCEAIMRDEFSLLQERLMILEQRNINLFERLRQLEAEKVELETTVMDESQSHVHESGNSGEQGQGASETDTDDDRENNVGPEAETDEEDDVFFDTKESLVTESFGHSASLSRQSSADLARDLWRSDSAIDNSKRYANGSNVGMELVGFNYPHVKRRKGLPQPKEKEKGVSLWSMIKDNIGKDLTKICLPVYFNEPISSLQKCFEDLEYSYLLDRAYEYGRRGNNLMRILNVAAFAISGYASTEGRTCKPFNPLLGETYEADYPDRGLRFISEKVSHHPMIVACHCQGRGWVFWGDSTLKSKFWGRSIQLDPVGILTLKFADGEIFQWSKVTTSIYNLILGKIYCDHYGTMRIQGNQELFCKLKFKEHSVLERNPHQVQGYVHNKSGDKLATLFGKWDESMYYILGDLATKPKGYDPMSEAVLLWRCNRPPEFPTRYNLTEFAITLNELTPGLKERLPPTDSRLRPDQRHLENGEYELANAEKLRLEQKQRRARKLQERGWQPRWFRKGEGSDTFEYLGGYWEVREQGKWDGCPDIFGPTTPEEPLD